VILAGGAVIDCSEEFSDSAEVPGPSLSIIKRYSPVSLYGENVVIPIRGGAMYKAVQTSRLYEQIVRQIQDSIESGALKEGDQLPVERELAVQFKVSRTAVREAMKALHEKGLIEAYPGRGTFIASNAARSIQKTLDRMIRGGPADSTIHLVVLREILEPEIAALAAQQSDKETLSALREAIAVMDAAQKDAEAFIEGDLDFHLALAEAAANPLILSLIDSIVGLLREQRTRIYLVEGGPERGQYHHKRILDAIEHRDSTGAREAMKAHLKQVRADSTSGTEQELPRPLVGRRVSITANR
jgi:GntR family transcriptional repressor for pyruvate dehydrogenase complex